MTLTTEEEQWVKEQVKDHGKFLQARAICNQFIYHEDRVEELRKIYPERSFNME